MKLTAACATIALLLTAALGTTPAHAETAEGSGVTVAWPEVTRFNPSQTNYAFTITNPADAHLFYSWGGVNEWIDDIDGLPVPDSGAVTVAFPDSGWRHGVVRVWECTQDQWMRDDRCTEVAASPVLDVYSRIDMMTAQGSADARSPGLNHVKWYYAPRPAVLGSVPTGTWELLDADANPLVPAATGTMTADDFVIDNGTTLSNMAFTIPEDLPTGEYLLDVRVAADTADFGHLEGSLRASGRLMRVVVDADAPDITVDDYPSTMYPIRDQHLDYIQLNATTNEWVTAVLEVTDASGDVVFRNADLSISPPPYTSELIFWDGRRTNDKLLPAGKYTMSLTATDRAGNDTTWTGDVEVSDKSLQWTTFKRTVKAVGSVVGDANVGRCSTLKRARGALGFYSQTKCRGNNTASVVATTHGIHIPKAFKKRWDYAQVTLNGGPATGAASNYIVLGYISTNRRHDLVNTKIFRSGNRGHVGMKLPLGSRNVFDRGTDKPYFLWSNGLTAGSRYDVRSYTVKVRYQTLRR